MENRKAVVRLPKVAKGILFSQECRPC